MTARQDYIAKPVYLTPEEVAERYRDAISVGTLANWRAMRVGPPYIKIGKAVLYPVEALDAWDKQNLVNNRTGKVGSTPDAG